ncbi:hypothetical protein ACFQL4_23095 [Halosimplex aquaticum]
MVNDERYANLTLTEVTVEYGDEPFSRHPERVVTTVTTPGGRTYPGLDDAIERRLRQESGIEAQTAVRFIPVETTGATVTPAGTATEAPTETASPTATASAPPPTAAATAPPSTTTQAPTATAQPPTATRAENTTSALRRFQPEPGSHRR